MITNKFMALINCPECNKQISDQAPACIQCGYPLASKNLGQQSETNPSEKPSVQHSVITNKEIVVALASKKSEGLAFIFTFFFGPLGLFYADEKKALIVIAVGLVLVFISFGFDNPDSFYIGLSIVLWLVSMFLAMISVTEYNNKISSGLIGSDANTLEEPSIDNPEISFDSIQELNRLINLAHSSSLVPSTLKDKIISLIHEICEEKSDCYFLLKEYKSRFSSDLVEDLKELSNSHDTIKSYLEPFIDFGFVSKDFPHKPI
jgi:hypothetical protein